MQIASPTNPPVPTPGKVESSRTTPGASAPARDGADPVAQADGADTPGFGTLLAQRLKSGGYSDVPQQDDPISLPPDPNALIGPDGLPIATTNALAAPTQDDTDLAASIAATATPATVPTTAPSTAKAGTDIDAAKNPADDGAVTDLAAQLALVSQWAALAQPVVAPGGNGPADPKADTLDVRGKLDTVRAGAAKVDTATVAGDDATAIGPAGVATTTAAYDRNTRALPTSGTAVKAADAKARDDAGVAGIADRPATTEALLAKVEAVVTPASTAATSLANAFANPVTGAAASASAGSPNLTTLSSQVGTPAWSHEVGQATLRLAASDLQGASLRLNPEHLGPLDVQVRVDNGVAHLSFTAAHAETRQALESSRTTLDQMFADQGLKIGDCAVSDSSSQRRFDAEAARDGAARRDGGRWGLEAAGATDTTTTVSTTVRRALGLVDTFA